MITLQPKDYPSIKPFLKNITIENTYPDAIYSGLQTGNIFVDQWPNPQCVIFWHHCGMAYLSGYTDSYIFHEELLDLLLHCHDVYHRNFYLILMPLQTDWFNTLHAMILLHPELRNTQRFCFTFDTSLFHPDLYHLPNDYNYFTIAPEHIEAIKGRVIPSYSWESLSDYFEHGFGYGIMDTQNQKIATTAFSSSIGKGKVDIGIETQPSCRKLGLGRLIGAKMVKEILALGLKPDWGCDAANIGSASIAKSIGFRQDIVCETFHL